MSLTLGSGIYFHGKMIYLAVFKYYHLCYCHIIWVDFSEDLTSEGGVSPSKKLEDLIHLGELCVDLLQQNEEHYAEVRIKYHF